MSLSRNLLSHQLSASASFLHSSLCLTQLWTSLCLWKWLLCAQQTSIFSTSALPTLSTSLPQWNLRPVWEHHFFYSPLKCKLIILTSGLVVGSMFAYFQTVNLLLLVSIPFLLRLIIQLSYTLLFFFIVICCHFIHLRFQHLASDLPVYLIYLLSSFYTTSI